MPVIPTLPVAFPALAPHRFANDASFYGLPPGLAPHSILPGQTIGTTTSPLSFTVTGQSNPGDHLVVTISINNTTRTISAVSDSAGNTYTQDGASTGGSPMVYQFRSDGDTGGPGGGPTAALSPGATFSVTCLAQSGQLTVFGWALPGAAFGPLDQLVVTKNVQPAVPWSQACTPTVDNEIAVIGMSGQSVNGWYNVPAPEGYSEVLFSVLALMTNHPLGVGSAGVSETEAVYSAAGAGTAKGTLWLFKPAAAPPQPIQAVGPIHLRSLAGPVNVTLPNPTGTGNTLVACISANGSTANPLVSSVKVGGSADSWASAISFNSTTRANVEIWYDPDATPGQTAVAVTFGSGGGVGDLWVSVYEVPGILVADKVLSNESTAPTWGVGPTPNLSNNAEIAFGVELAYGSRTPQADPRWTTQTTSGPINTFQHLDGYETEKLGYPITWNGTLSGGATGSTEVVATFYALPGVPQEAAAALSGSGALTAAITDIPGAGGVPHAVAAALDGNGTLTGAAQKTVPGAVALTGQGAFGATVQKTVPGAVALQGAGSLAGAGAKAVPGTVAMTGTGTLTPTVQKTVPGTAAMSGAGALSSVLRKAVPGSIALQGTGTLTPTVQKTVPGAVALAGSGTLTDTITDTKHGAHAGASTLGGVGAFTAGAVKTVPGAAALSGVGTATAGLVKTVPGTVSINGTGVFTAGAYKSVPGSVALSGRGNLSSVVVKTVPGASALNGSGTLASNVSRSGFHSGVAALGGVGSVTVIGYKTIPGAAALNGTGALLSTVTRAGVHQAAAALTGFGTISDQARKSVGGVATLNGVGSMGGVPGFTVAAALSGQGKLTGAWSLSIPGVAALSGQGSMAGVPGFLVSAALSGNGTLGAAIRIKPPGVSAALDGNGTLSAPRPSRILHAAIHLDGGGVLTAGAFKSVRGAVSLLGTGRLTASWALTIPANAALDGTGYLFIGTHRIKGVPPAALEGTGTLVATFTVVRAFRVGIMVVTTNGLRSTVRTNGLNAVASTNRIGASARVNVLGGARVR